MRRLKVIAIALTLVSLTPFSAYAAYIAERGTTIVPGMAGVYVDGIYMGHDGEGAVTDENGNVLIPARYIDLYAGGNYDGSDISWDGERKLFTAERNEDGKAFTISSAAGECFSDVNGKREAQEVRNVIIGDRLYIPVETALKYYGVENIGVSFVEKNVILNISKEKYDVFQTEGYADDKYVENCIKTMDAEFSADNFTKKIVETDDNSDAERFVIYKYTVDKTETNLGYFAAVYNNRVEITAMAIGREIYNAAGEAVVDGDITEDELKKMALEADGSSREVISQRVDRHFVPAVGREVFDVTTVYANGDIVYETLNRYIIK